MREHGIAGDELAHVGHGTTVATNMVIERRGSRCALVTTRGFRDVLEIGRQPRPHLYDYNVIKPAPLAPREWRFEIGERMAADGTVLQALDEDEVVSVARQLAEAQVESVAICFMHSYRNDTHERRTRDILAECLPGVYLSVSSEILPEFREYERMSTTALNAYVGPRMASYMRNLVGSVQRMGVGVAPTTVHSNGGLMSVDRAWTGGGLSQPDHLRRGRHQHRRLAGGRTAAAIHLQPPGGRLSGQDPDGRRARHRRGRRQHRAYRRCRRAEGRPAERRRRAWPDRVQPGRHGGHPDGRACRAGAPESRGAA
ncbi:hypothetical protein G6F65_016428 [Rhizopus arrhizus]|nr:hypothetical protein G6F65_016428 [Rhizopus arrhizus]